MCVRDIKSEGEEEEESVLITRASVPLARVSEVSILKMMNRRPMKMSG